MTILGIAGSLRKESLNRWLIESFKKFAPEGITFEIAEIADIPLFNQDLESNFPASAQALKDKIKTANGVIIATPEYSRSIPGVLKNTLDWTARPYGMSAWIGKPVFTVGATGGFVGTAAAQADLKKILVNMGAYVLGIPEFYMGGAKDKFDTAGNLTDQATKDQIAKAYAVFVGFVQKNS